MSSRSEPPGPAAKHEHAAGIGVGLQTVLAEPGQAIDALAEVHRLDGDQDRIYVKPPVM